MTLAMNHRYIIRSLRFFLLVCLFQASRLQAANVTSVSPTVNRNNVATSSDIVVTFDASVPAAAVNTANFVVNGAQSGRIAGVLTGGGTNTITFNPTRDFKAGEVVTITLTSGLGLPSSGYTWQFTVAAAAVVPAFTTIPPVATNATIAYEVYPIDLDGDGDVDMLSVALNGGVSWYENNGSQTLIPHSITPTSATSPTSLRAADLDDDGDIDIVVTSYGDNKIIWLENNGAEVFTPRTLESGEQVTFVYTEDMDGDGDVDVLAACEAFSKIILYKNDGTGVFTPNTIATGITNVNSLYAADVDGDGDMDVLASSFNNFSLNDGKITWYENRQSPVFTAFTVSTAVQYARGVYAADMDRDGDMDVVSVSDSNGQIFWHENNGSQTFTDHTAVALTATAGAQSVHAADIDGDGDLDLLGYHFGNKQVLWHENDGTQNFTNHIVSTGADGVMTIYAADVDGDGDMDIMTASLNDNRIAWFPNTGSPVANRAPAFTKGADIEVNEDAPLQSLTAWATNISAGPPGGESNQTLSFLVSNNNTALFSTQPAIDAAGTLTFKSVDNASGVATVTVLLKDNGGTANGGVDQSAPATFVITVHPVNDAPWVDAVADITLAAGNAPVELTLTGLHPGPGEDSQHLTVTASSNAPFLLGNPSVTLHGDGTATLLLTPAPGAAGTIIVTIVIRDDGGTTRGGDDETVMTFTVTIERDAGLQTAFLPTLFSPNGDGANDALRVHASGIADIRFSVYSADGHEVFRTTDITEATEKGWNGRYHDRDMPAGTYTWTLQGHFTDGNPLVFGKHAYGQVVLLR